MFDSSDLEKLFSQAIVWLQDYILTFDFAFQLALIGAALLTGAVVRKRLLPVIQPTLDKLQLHYSTRLTVNNICRLIMQIVAVVMLLFGTRLAMAAEIEMGFAEAAMAMIAAWVLIKLVVQFIENSAVRNLFAVTIWALAALGILGILDETIATLNAVGMNIGDFRLSALSVIKGLLALSVLMYGAIFLSSFVERKVYAATSLTVSSRVLIGKMVRISLVTCALLIGITSSGIDLSLFAWFSGALGLGIGFGLQKGVSNLFSGMLLLMDKSIKPGDVIELPSTVETADPVFGWVEHMGARYTEIITRDNKSYLIPNEDFITRQVVNWSHGDTLIRLEVKFRVSYEHNPREVKAIAEKAVAGAHERIAADHPPLCHLSEFGETGLHFRMRFWIRDAEKGVVNIRGIVMMALWDAFHEHGIKIPYPHHEIIIHKNRKRA